VEINCISFTKWLFYRLLFGY